MATLEKIEILAIGGRREIRFDWDNDRHQSVELKDLKPESVIKALELAIFEIRSDIYHNELK